MIRVGITGQSGFIGTHLFNYLGLKEGIKRIPFQDDFFSSKEKLACFVDDCEVIIHLAALNRHNDPKVIYETNIELVNNLLNACQIAEVKPHIIFASSTQEEKDNLYGKSKRDGRILIENWSKENEARFTGLIIPNVFGPFGNPNYNSVIATFSHKLTHNEEPEIHVDGELKLIYINELVEEIWKKIEQTNNLLPVTNNKTQVTNHQSLITRYDVPHTSVNKVSSILEILKVYKSTYFDKGIIPQFNNKFEVDLFNTFRCYIDLDHFPYKLTKRSDERGSFTEIIRTNTSGQFSISTTKPDITRGNHFHTRKIERFCVIKGEAKIELRKVGSDSKVEYLVSGENPSFVDMPIWYTHNITNIGKEDLLTLFWINEPYDPEDPDTFYEDV